MKRLIFIFFASTCFAQYVTPNLGITEPTVGMQQNTWGPLINGGTDILDNVFALSTCNDSTHYVGWDKPTKQLTCQPLISTGSGTVSSGTLGQPAIYTATGTVVGSSNQAVDASAFSGATWLDKAIAAATSISNVGTVLVPPSLASTAAYPSGTIPTGITLEFTGGGDFGICSITEGKFTKIINPGSAVLKMNSAGSGCTALIHSAQATLQEDDRTILSAVRIDCNGQPGSTGISFTNGSAQDAFYSVSVQKCGSVAGGAGVFLADQFGSYHDLVLQQNYVNLKMYTTDAQAGVSSNTFYNLKTNAPASGVNVILANTNTGGQIQTDNWFINHQCQNGSIACIAMFGNGSPGSLKGHWLGTAPELDNGGASSITIDGFVIKQAGAFYVNNALLDLKAMDNGDALANPGMLLENHAHADVSDLIGYGGTGNTQIQSDSTSTVSLPGTVQTEGQIYNITQWPSTIMPGGNGLRMAGSPIYSRNSTIPNAYTANSLTPAVSSVGTGTTNSTAVDAVYGTVTTATHAASIGSSSTNFVNFGNVISSATSVTSDYMMSFLTKSSVDASYRFNGTIGTFTDLEITLKAGIWTRVVLFMPAQTAATAFNLLGWPLDTSGPTVSYTALEVLALPTNSVTQRQYMGAVLATGAVNPNGFSGTLCSGTVALGTGAISSGTAATTVTATCTGLLSTDNIMLDFNASPLAVTGYTPSASGMLTIIKWPTANTINVSVVNNTGGSITPGAITMNFRVTR